jgi:hypothetical protein
LFFWFLWVLGFTPLYISFSVASNQEEQEEEKSIISCSVFSMDLGLCFCCFKEGEEEEENGWF